MLPTNNQGKLIVGIDDARLSEGAGQDPGQAGAPTGKLYVATDVGVYVGGAGRDVLVGGRGQDASFDGQGRLLIGTDGSVWRNANADSTNDDNNDGTHVGGDDRLGWE